MIKRSFGASALITGVLLSGVLAAPAFAQSYGVKPRGYCPPQQTSRVQYAPAPVQMMYQPAQIAGDSTPAPERSRSRKGRGFPSPF